METLVGSYEQRPVYEPITVDLGADDINEAMRLYLEFIELPYEDKIKFHYFDRERPRTGDSGYMHKGIYSPEGVAAQDNKHIFHFSPEMREVQRTVAYFRQAPEARAFLAAADDIYADLSRAVQAKFSEWQDDIPWLVGMHFPRDGASNNHLRFLAYQDSGEGLLARGHYDKGTATVAVAESHGGLRLGAGEEDLTLLERDTFDPVIFQGFGWHQVHEMLDAQTDRKAGWHDVVDVGEEVSDDIVRWALIYFVNPAKIYLDSTTEQTHTPIPWRNVGRVALTRDERSFLLKGASDER